MPSNSDFNELVDNCDNVWTTLNGVFGRLFTSRINRQVLFLPAAGYFDRINNSTFGSLAHYWSSIYKSQTVSFNMYFGQPDMNPNSQGYRHFGFCIRPVQGGTPNRSIIPPTTEDEPREEETPTVEEPKDDNER